jgi:hypothetical protein
MYGGNKILKRIEMLHKGLFSLMSDLDSPYRALKIPWRSCLRIAYRPRIHFLVQRQRQPHRVCKSGTVLPWHQRFIVLNYTIS